MPEPYSYDCPCGWSRTILEGETVEDAKRKHEGTDIHKLSNGSLNYGLCENCGEETLINYLTDMCESCTAEDERDRANYGSEDETWNYPG